MTAYSMQGDQEACLAAWMDDYFSTPLTSEGLRQTLVRWISEMEQTERHFRLSKNAHIHMLFSLHSLPS